MNVERSWGSAVQGYGDFRDFLEYGLIRGETLAIFTVEFEKDRKMWKEMAYFLLQAASLTINS